MLHFCSTALDSIKQKVKFLLKKKMRHQGISAQACGVHELMNWGVCRGSQKCCFESRIDNSQSFTEVHILRKGGGNACVCMLDLCFSGNAIHCSCIYWCSKNLCRKGWRPSFSRHFVSDFVERHRDALCMDNGKITSPTRSSDKMLEMTEDFIAVFSQLVRNRSTEFILKSQKQGGERERRRIKWLRWQDEDGKP